jgi:hypothetical protein
MDGRRHLPNKPGLEPRSEGVVETVGQFIQAIETTSSAHGRTFGEYIRSFRRIVAEAFGIDDPKKYDYRRGGHTGWIERIDAIPLAKITPQKVQGWKVDFLARAGRSPTEHFHPKSEDSIASVDLDPEFAELFQTFKQAATKGEFVIESPVAAKPNTRHAHYRCQIVFKRLARWLRAYGVTGKKPLHLLRKEFGSRICESALTSCSSGFTRFRSRGLFTLSTQRNPS